MEDSKAVKEYFAQQAGHGLNVFSGVSRQRGYGLESLLSKGLSMATPFMKKAANRVGKSLLTTGLSLASDILSEKNMKSTATRRLKEVGTDLLAYTVSYLAPKPAKKAVKRKRSTSSRRKGKRTRSDGIFS